MKRKKGLHYLITAVVSLSISLGVLLARGYFSMTDYNGKMAALSDAFFVPGILLSGFGILVVIADEGFFDIFRYGLLKLVSSMRIKNRDEDMPKDFYEYRTARHGEKKGFMWHILITGIADLLLAVLFLFLYQG